jgi:Transposase, Mutator family
MYGGDSGRQARTSKDCRSQALRRASRRSPAGLWPSIINATRSSPDRSAASSSARAVSVIALRRVVLRRCSGHRHRRGQASAGAGGGLHGERDSGHRPVGGSARAGPGCDPPDAGRPGRLSKALRKAVVDVLDHPVIQRCQLHKVRNVKDHLPQRLRGIVGRRMTDAYHAPSALEAEAALLILAKELDRTHPGAAASLRRAWTRPSRYCAWTFRPRWPAPCDRLTASSR